MSDFNDQRKNELGKPIPNTISSPKSKAPEYEMLQKQLAEASKLVGDIVLKNYLTQLTKWEIVPLDNSLKNIGDIRLFKINEIVYQKNEYSTYKFASVFNSVQNLNCGIFIIADSNGKETNFYMGVRSLDDKRTTKSLKDTLRNALCGQFPGVKTQDLLDSEAEDFIKNIQAKNIASVSCVAKNKDDEFTDNDRFIQGLEKLALAMQGQRYTAVILAKSTPAEQLAEARHAYEMIFTNLSPFATMQLSYGTNSALSISEAFSSGSSRGSSHSTNRSTQKGTSYSKGTTFNESTTKPDGWASVKGIGTALLGIASIVTAPLTGAASLIAAGAIMAGQLGLGAITPSTKTKGTSTSENYTENTSETYGESDSVNESINESATNTKGLTSGMSDNMQLTRQDKSILNTLERIDLQLKRINECESLGMWECAAYFLSDSQETAEMAAGTYKALMKGENSGVETSAINFWGRGNKDQLPILREYITNFIHPVFEYPATPTVPVTAASLISGNELAIHMGLPRKSVSGFPVIEHTEFGKETVKYRCVEDERNFLLGKVFNMGTETGKEMRLARDSLTMHTFITGSTGSGKSNTSYEILNQLKNVYNIPFLVIEPAKGEYKSIFGKENGVKVYGTNPYISPLLRINPFAFPEKIHILEHLDRLIEIFNVCWPMYAAMPAVLKKSVEKSYEESGWDLKKSKNKYEKNYQQRLFPTFGDIVFNIRKIIDSSEYGDENKGNYKGALITRLESLTNGINGVIFCNEELSNQELFDSNVIVDLSRVGSMETKALIMGLLVMKLQEYRMTGEEMNCPLRHITVLEEAHNLLKRTSSEQSSDSAYLLGKSVEMLSNAISEMRTYGEGFIIADQAPGLLDMSVIRNTNTKIILRLPDKGDRELVGKAANLNDDQIEELAKLPCGVAAVYQNDWIQPVLCKINDFSYDVNGKKKEEFIYKADSSILPILEDDDDELLKRKIVFQLFSNLIDNAPEQNLEKLRIDVYKSNIETRLKVKILDFFEKEVMPKELTRELYHVIGGLYHSTEDAIKDVLTNKERALAFRDSIKPKIICFNKYPDLQYNLAECVIREYVLTKKGG